jgi:hypothetical protein
MDLFCPISSNISPAGLKRALAESEEALRELATAARWVDRSAFGKEEGFAQAQQALLNALDRAGRFV